MSQNEKVKPPRRYGNVRIALDVAKKYKMLCLALNALPHHKLEEIILEWIKQESKKTKISITM